MKPGIFTTAASIFFALTTANPFTAHAEETLDPGVDIDLMHFMEETNDQLTSDLAIRDKNNILEGAQMLAELLQMVEEHFNSWNQSETALVIARKSTTIAMDIVAAAELGEFETATQKGIELSNQCENCHKIF